MNLYDVLEKVREQKPLVQCITNFVTVNDCANILFAAGASPTMSMDIREVEESVQGANALVCNLGAIEYVDSMAAAGKAANTINVPVVLDPVAAGRTQIRRDSSKKLLEEVHFSVIRGNASEIRGLAMGSSYGSGVDVSELDVIHEHNIKESVEVIRTLAKKTNSVIAVSGKLDVISDGDQTMILHNGCPMMARITGSGCMVTTLIGAFCGAVPNEPFLAACSAMAVMGIAGEIAEEKRLVKGTGNATFRTDLIDAVFTMAEEQFKEKIRYEIYKR